MNNTCFCPADGVFPAGQKHVLGGLLPATSLLHGRVPPSRSGQCRVDGQAVLGVHDATSEFIRCGWWRRADLLSDRFGLGDDQSPRRSGLLRGSLRRPAEPTGLTGSLPVQLGAEPHRGLRHRPRSLPLRLRRHWRAHPLGSRLSHICVQWVATFPRSRPIWQCAGWCVREKWQRCWDWQMDGWMDDSPLV